MPPKLFDKFEVLETLNRGPLGFCLKVKNKEDGQLYTWRELHFRHMTSEEKKMLVSELNLLHQLQHPRIVRCVDSVISRRTSTLYMVHEYFPDTLDALILQHRSRGTPVRESLVWRVLVHLSQALYAYHMHQGLESVTLPCDLRPQNICIDPQGNAKLRVCGLTGILTQESEFVIKMRTAYYMAPEQVCSLCCSEKSDVWSLGCLIYELCTTRNPFPRQENNTYNAPSMFSQLIDNDQQVKLGDKAVLPVVYSDELKSLLGWLLTYNTEQRPDFRSILIHPSIVSWIRNSEAANLAHPSLSHHPLSSSVPSFPFNGQNSLPPRFTSDCLVPRSLTSSTTPSLSPASLSPSPLTCAGVGEGSTGAAFEQKERQLRAMEESLKEKERLLQGGYSIHVSAFSEKEAQIENQQRTLIKTMLSGSNVRTILGQNQSSNIVTANVPLLSANTTLLSTSAKSSCVCRSKSLNHGDKISFARPLRNLTNVIGASGIAVWRNNHHHQQDGRTKRTVV